MYPTVMIQPKYVCVYGDMQITCHNTAVNYTQVIDHSATHAAAYAHSAGFHSSFPIPSFLEQQGHTCYAFIPPLDDFSLAQSEHERSALSPSVWVKHLPIVSQATSIPHKYLNVYIVQVITHIVVQSAGCC